MFVSDENSADRLLSMLVDRLEVDPCLGIFQTRVKKKIATNGDSDSMLYFTIMDLSKALQMDPHLLVGLLNTELRNHCDSLEDLVKTHHLEVAAVLEKMAAADYQYRPEQNQFR